MFPIAFFRSPNLSKPLQGGGGGARLLKMPVIACLTLITKNVTVVFETLENAERGWGKGEEQWVQFGRFVIWGCLTKLHETLSSVTAPQL